jgi:DNA-binding transcriptional LysR family regulator
VSKIRKSWLHKIHLMADEISREAQIWNLVTEDGQSEKVTVHPRMLCSDMAVQLQAAISGVGVALLPRRTVASGLKYGALIQLASAWGTPEESINLVFATRRGMLPSVRSLVDHLVAHLPAALG